MAFETYDERRGLSFEQAEGLSPLPTQLQRAELSPVLRARVWQFIALIIENNHTFSDVDWYMTEPWATIARDEFIHRHGGFIDRDTISKDTTEQRFSGIIKTGDYSKFYGLIQFIISHPRCPAAVPEIFDNIFVEQRSAFRISGGDTLVAVSTQQELDTIEAALKVTEASEFSAPHRHLRNALRELGAGKYADSVRESIHSVESIARNLEPTADLSKALGRLEKSGHLHRAMKHGFGSLYGYTSDEGGIRHALLEDGDAKVDEADAIFMIGACASFVTYLISKKRAAGITE